MLLILWGAALITVLVGNYSFHKAFPDREDTGYINHIKTLTNE